MGVPWSARRSNQSTLKEISPGCSLEGLMLKLKLQYFGYLMQRADSFEKTLILGKIEVRRRRGWQRMSWLDGITDSMDIGLGGLRELVIDMKDWRAAVHEVTKSRTQLSKWTELNGNLSQYNRLRQESVKEVFLNNAICSNMDELWDWHTEWSKSDWERQTSYDIAYMWNLEK